MAFIQWQDNFNTGVETIDEQHKKLVELLNTLVDAMKAGKSEEVLFEILNSLAEYTIFHFDNEESLMVKYGYKDYNSHFGEHKELKKEVQNFITKHKQGRLMISIELMNYLSKWLRGHILGTDKKLGSYLKEKM